MLFTPLLGGCSAVKLAYGQGEWLGWWWLDGHVDFNAQQKPQVKLALAEWFVWHRQTQLPDYADLVGRLAVEVRQPVTAEQACQWLDQAVPRVHAAWQQALPAMARQVQTLQPAQLRHLQKKLEARNREFREEFIEPPEDERREKRLKTWRERYQDLYGRLLPAQEALLQAAAVALADDPLQREAEHQAHQRELLAVLTRLSTDKPGDEASAAALAAWLRPSTTLGGWGSPAWQAAQRTRRLGHCELFASLHQASTPAQREHAVRWLQGWERDLRDMAGQPRAGAPGGGAVGAQGVPAG
ncbi:DUF6279 family lipoprotein [Ideonella livida]|uniref:Uncharacterized protein n=1 Tax=Ideonella livida TaxID=2707176 RepID=A0A7C9TLY7_9BURK|nr:DUF6279 family lipoprotein [Ideonella livida]NDY93880.1 hypothetical protein [Ideonella livida]